MLVFLLRRWVWRENKEMKTELELMFVIEEFNQKWSGTCSKMMMSLPADV